MIQHSGGGAGAFYPRLRLQPGQALEGSKQQMNVDVERAKKLLQKLRRLLKALPRNPGPEPVHQLRTLTRKLEAIVYVASPGRRKDSRRLLRLMKPIRRAAGRVRDMDVLIGKATSLSPRANSEGVLRLIEHIAAIRAADAQRLFSKVDKRRKEARSSLSKLRRALERLGIPNGSGTSPDPAPAQALARRLEHWPRLSGRNLHEFRKGVKKLRYMLQLVPNHHHGMSVYRRVKNTTGDWHDWLELKCLAESVLDRNDDTPLLREIKVTLHQKFEVALKTANSLRKPGVEMLKVA